ncbi:DASH family cryptochrome [Mucilaginibacter phyllosphaerae]|uniref:Cryptochrome DASH n=1 Tax=Mucilaginibacter phyllosphaerae TaxID=1812349 RepID=A0A4Y8AK65_9SPHI|nr:DASH family cryptochrome [Mucilaginibacter phyllosphaerae]MBB3967543.1 deoxyribodipyrimidine photo-lyase [Mucilaginibacter phyllosphaerae]TEW69397.1 DASH family cryptochrome [Mucilaginibacter phyllosphaerae]GGH21318.1 deoxyribodipyrimidine photo-lyase [Mucilaginibacter phyllosphaerae]
MSEKVILVWFRNDLRIHDNEILSEAVRRADKILPVYIFDPFYFKTSAGGALKTGSFRARFLLEAVADLRKNLQAFGAELLLRTGDPAEVLTQLADEYHVSEVYHHREVAPDETDASERVEAALWKMKLNLKHFIGHTMYHKEDLPFPIKDIPDSFVTFKKKVERDSTVRPGVAGPDHIITPDITDAGELPTLADLGIPQPVDDVRATEKFVGGETTALKQLHLYLENCLPNNQGKNVRGALCSASGLSPWLAVGCISPRQVYWEVVNYLKDNHLANTDPIMLELLWRDYFRFMFKKHGQKFFRSEGFGDAPDMAANQDELFDQWKNGETGVPYIDAAMHQLNATGYITNYSRQAVATYLTKDLQVDWTKGALYFEEKLIDYSPASNWGNWAFVAGVGNDTKSNRFFSAAKPTDQLDTKSDFIATWLPAAKNRDGEPAVTL